VPEGDPNRLIAWDRELSAVHHRLRRALDRTRGPAPADLLLFCHGFCAALAGHHQGEDGGLFPELAARHPALRPVIAKLTQDHELIAALLRQLEQALAADAPPGALERQLDGIAAIMESHFRYEERQLLAPLATLDLDADPRALLGPP
jgi:hypothetical protein